jgi:hypothetical protein
MLGIQQARIPWAGRARPSVGKRSAHQSLIASVSWLHAYARPGVPDRGAGRGAKGIRAFSSGLVKRWIPCPNGLVIANHDLLCRIHRVQIRNL